MDSAVVCAEPDPNRVPGCNLSPEDYLNAAVTSPRYEVEPQNDALACDPANQSLDTSVSVENPEGPDLNDSAQNIVETWADEFYRMAPRPESFETFPPAPPPAPAAPCAMTPYFVDPAKQFECPLCKTTYATLARLKRHYGTKKHKALAEKAEAPPPKHQEARGLPPRRLPQMPQFQTFSDMDPYPADWAIFHNQLDFLRAQPQMAPVEPHQNIFFQPHVNYPFGSLCNTHQSAQYLPEAVPSPDPRYPPSYYQPQTPTPSWYYPITPYPSPNPYLQRHPEYPPPEHQKYEANNNFPAEPFDQRPIQQEALNLWTAKPSLDVTEDSVEEVPPSSDGSETMSPDSQNEPVSSTECAASPERVKCEQCHREVSNVGSDAGHPKCETCGQSYPSVVSMLVKNAVKCEICDTEFGSRVELTRHKHLHKGRKEFSCHLCPKSCDRKDQLLRHLRVHEPHGESQAKQY
ncbi:unnamed protein product [Bemisia tabaci]|uniref:C2H2-type domain-containing protein n=1 Tax=Bemisia tabaci TaxID=7038 RepID=A0A9N9ZYC3_BEMTA|nr:unnamed protein product [Bemisia tabaci]